ncbi:hypothetical protein K443DRAFT_109152, partial [Laccaria amethystina LaAM-08-1]
RRSTRYYVRTTQLPPTLVIVQPIIISCPPLTLDAAYILHRFTVDVEGLSPSHDGHPRGSVNQNRLTPLYSEITNYP